MRQNLEFRGSSTSLFGDLLVLWFLSLVTLGIYYPWGWAQLRRKILSETYYHDQPLVFDGNGGELFGIMLKNVILSLITLGIYGLLMYPAVAVLKWDAEHTILPNGERLEYNGTGLDLFGEVLIVSLAITFTLGILSFWGYVRIRRHIISQTALRGQPLQYTGSGGQYFGVCIVNAALSLVTAGIYALLGCAMVRELRWDAENTIVPYQPDAFGPPSYPGYIPPIQVNVNVGR